MIELVIMGEPLAKKRPRFSTANGFVRTHSAQKNEETDFAWVAKEQIKEELEGPLILTVYFYLKRAKGHYGSGRNSGIVKNSSPVLPTKKPDLDNLVKFVKDCLNGIAWHDDSQVVDLISCKRYTTEEPRTEVKIEQKRGERETGIFQGELPF